MVESGGMRTSNKKTPEGARLALSARRREMCRAAKRPPYLGRRRSSPARSAVTLAGMKRLRESV